MTGLLDRADRLHMAAAAIHRTVTFAIGEADGGRGAIYDEAEAFRRRLLKGELQATQTVIDHWRRIREAILEQIKELAAIVLDPDADPADGRALERLVSQAGQIRQLLGEYAARVEADLAGIMLDVGQLGADQAETLVGLQLPPRAALAGVLFDRLPREAVEQMVAAVTEGPLRGLLASIGPEFIEDLQAVLVDGVGLGRSPRDTAQRLTQLADMPRWRALNIARTETMRAYREANRRTLTRNRRVVEGWRWSAALDSRTCPVCWAMHGTLFPVEATFGSHPSCRCAPVPATKSWSDLGVPDVQDGPQLQMTAGPELFARQPAYVQRAVLGPGKYAAWKDGRFDLADLVGIRQDATWGEVRFERPLAALIGDQT